MIESINSLKAPIRPLICKILKSIEPGGDPAIFDLTTGVYSYASVLSTTSRIKKTLKCEFISQRRRDGCIDKVYIWKTR